MERWPDLSHFFGIHPWDTGRLSGAELAKYLETLDDLAAGRG
jgi:hypothetical protein